MASDFWFKFNFKDWADDVKPLTLTARGLLIELIIYLRKNNGEMPVDINLISRLTGGLTEEITVCITEFKKFGIMDFADLPDGGQTMVSRRIKKEIAKSLINSENGKKGGNPRLTESDNQEDKAQDNQYSNSIFISNYNSYISYLNEKLKKKYQGSDKVKKQFGARLKDGYVLDDFKKAIDNGAADSFHAGEGYKHLTAEFFTRADKLDKFLQASDPVIVPLDPKKSVPGHLSFRAGAEITK